MTNQPETWTDKDARRRDAVARVRTALARIQMRRQMRRAYKRGVVFDIGLFVVVACAVFAGLITGWSLLIDSTGLRAGQLLNNHPGLFGLSLMTMLGPGIVLLILIAASIIIPLYGVMFGLRGVWKLPFHLRDLWLWTRHKLRQRRYLQTLATDGVVSLRGEPGILHSKSRAYHSDWTLLRDIAEADSELEYDDKTLSVFPKDRTPSESCPKCRAPLAHPEPGIRRCQFCGFE